MSYIADLHVHSKYSRATSRDMDVANLAKWAKIKGISLLGSADYTHPAWLAELKKNLEPKEDGIFQHAGVDFILSTEVSNIYFKAGRTRKVHNIIFSPDFKTVDGINSYLRHHGTLEADGRPMLDVPSDKMVKEILKINPDCIIVPAHVWTPHFSVFGSNSGFDKIEECFEDQTKNIYSLETGLSSDPAMNWRWSKLDRFTLMSNSDAHCVHPDTNIYSTNGKPLAIKNLNPSNVLSVDFGGDLRQTEGKVSKLHKLISPSILCRTATRTKEIITTPEHRFFVLENEEIIEKKASELKRGDLVACLRQVLNEGKSRELPYFVIDHKLKIFPKGINYLRLLRMKNEKTQRDVGRHIGVKENCVWVFEKHKIKTPKESFINKYCEYLGIDEDKFKKKFLVSRFPLEKLPRFTNTKFCQILGYALGDGGIERHGAKIKNLSLTDKSINLLTYYQHLIKEVFNIKGKLRKKKGASYSVRYPVYLAEYFQKIDPKILAPSLERQIPEFIFDLPKKEIAAFLGGLFDAEGTNAHHSIQFSSSSLSLIKEIQALLLKFGLQSSVYSDFEKNKKKWRYKLSIYGQRQLEKFASEIKFCSKIKKEKLLKYLFSLWKSPKDCFADPLPIKNEILKVKKELAISYYDIPKRLYYHFKHNNTLKQGNVKEFIEISSKYLKKLPLQKQSIIKKLKKFVASDIIWESIQETKKVRSNCKHVYDLTVPDYGNYVANGFITHNSPSKIGREANVFNTPITYKDLIEILRNKDKSKFLYTIEFFPQEGKYHWDGHRACNQRLSPKESKNVNNRCPICGRKLTIGVLNRVEKLGNRDEGFVLESSPSFKNFVPLVEIIADALGVGAESMSVQREYNKLIQNFGSEFKILLEVSSEELTKSAPPKIAKGIIRVRESKVTVIPGYDGVYGEIRIFGEGEDAATDKQLTFF